MMSMMLPLLLLKDDDSGSDDHDDLRRLRRHGWRRWRHELYAPLPHPPQGRRLW